MNMLKVYCILITSHFNMCTTTILCVSGYRPYLVSEFFVIDNENMTITILVEILEWDGLVYIDREPWVDILTYN